MATLLDTLFYFVLLSILTNIIINGNVAVKLVFNMKKGKQKYTITFSKQSQPLAYFPISFPESFCVCVVFFLSLSLKLEDSDVLWLHYLDPPLCVESSVQLQV